MTLYGGELRNISITKFLESYGKQECLWNTRISSYKDKAARLEAYGQIVKDLNIKGITHNDIRAKIKGVRTTYKKELELSLYKKSKGISYEPKLCWFKQADTFLRSVSTSRKAKLTDSSVENKPQTSSFTTDISGEKNAVESVIIEEMPEQFENDDEKGGSTMNISYEDIPAEDEETYQYEEFVEDTHPIIMKKEPSSNEKHNMTISSQQHQENESQKQNISYQEVYRQTYQNDDEITHFCNSVAAQLRNIPDSYSKSVAKFKIQQILFEAETGHYKKNACVTIPISN